MFAIDHAATALLVKKKYPAASMVWLLLSVQLMEILWVTFNYLGLERTTTEKAVASVSDIHLIYMPYSHSILSGLLLAVLGYFVARMISGNRSVGLAVGMAIVSHLVLDLITHAPDIALAPGINQPKFGLGLYGKAPMVAFVLEMVYGAFCWRVFKGSKSLLAVILLFNLANLSMLSSAVRGPEERLAGHPTMIVTVVAAQIAITLVLVGALSRRPRFPARLAVPLSNP
ncbi:MAG: hypothetical protein LAP39_30685 [Acidobacteriia bacterium]|nr:hypothetical protein [Terriglobia bacterium]